MECSLSSAPAEKETGELTDAPAAGEQICTVRSTVEVHAATAAFVMAKQEMKANRS